MEPEIEQSMLQRMIAIAQGDNAPVVIEILRSCVEQHPIVGETEFATVVNAVSMDAQAKLIQNVITKLESLRNAAFI